MAQSTAQSTAPQMQPSTSSNIPGFLYKVYRDYDGSTSSSPAPKHGRTVVTDMLRGAYETLAEANLAARVLLNNLYGDELDTLEIRKDKDGQVVANGKLCGGQTVSASALKARKIAWGTPRRDVFVLQEVQPMVSGSKIVSVHQSLDGAVEGLAKQRKVLEIP